MEAVERPHWIRVIWIGFHFILSSSLHPTLLRSPPSGTLPVHSFAVKQTCNRSLTFPAFYFIPAKSAVVLELNRSFCIEESVGIGGDVGK